MIKTIQGNILEATAGIIVHGCNAQGGPVGGLAKAIFDQYPAAQTAHENLVYAYTDKMSMLGKCSYYRTSNPNLIICNAVTQLFPGAGSLSYDAIESCFKEVATLMEVISSTEGSMPILFPKIGAGIAGGNWNIIEMIIDETVGKDHECILYVL